MRRLFRQYPVWCVLVVMLACLGPLMAMRDFSPSNELRYLSIADEALRDGHVFAFTNQGVPYADKPPLYLWIVMLCRLLFGRHSMFVLSLFSFVPAAVIILVMDKWVMRGREAVDRAAMAFMMGSSAMFLGLSVFLRMDMLMVMFDVLALRAFRRGKNGQFALYTFLALFTKGPVGLLVPPVTALVYILAARMAARRRAVSCGAPSEPADAQGQAEMSGQVASSDEGGIITRPGWWFGWRFWAILLGGCAVWFGGVYLDGGMDYLDNLLVHQTVGRAVNSFHHSRPVWYYLVLIWPVLLPWTFLCVYVFGVSLATIRRGAGEDEKLFVCMILSTFVMLSCFSAKLAIYLAPIFPFAVYLVPMTVERRGWRKCMDWLAAVPIGLFALVGTALAAAVLYLWLAPERDMLAVLRMADVPWAAVEPFLAGGGWLVAAGLALAAGGVGAVIALFKGQGLRSAGVFAMGLLVCALLASPLMPLANDYIGYGNLCKEIPAGEKVYARKVHRPEAMDVYLGRDVVKLEADDPLPSDGALITKASFEDPALEGRRRIVHGKYAVFLPVRHAL